MPEPTFDEFEKALDEVTETVRAALIAKYGEDAVKDRVSGFMRVDAGILGHVSVVIA